MQHFENAINSIIPYIEKYKDYPNLELEIRLGFFEDNKYFSTAIPEDFFKKIGQTLETNPNWNSTERVVVNDYFNNGLRMSVFSDGKRECIKKVKLVTMDFTFENTPFDVRVCISQEHPRDIDNFEDNEIIFKREKDRLSYKHKAWSFDITTIKTIENTIEDITFEVELEVSNLQKALEDYSTKYLVHSSLLKIKDLVAMCETVEDTSELKEISIKEHKI